MKLKRIECEELIGLYFNIKYTIKFTRPTALTT